jgi:hypothetical protein
MDAKKREHFMTNCDFNEPVRKPMVFRFFYQYDTGPVVDVDLEFYTMKDVEDWRQTEFNGLKYLYHARV